MRPRGGDARRGRSRGRHPPDPRQSSGLERNPRTTRTVPYPFAVIAENRLQNGATRRNERACPHANSENCWNNPGWHSGKPFGLASGVGVVRSVYVNSTRIWAAPRREIYQLLK